MVVGLRMSMFSQCLLYPANQRGSGRYCVGHSCCFATCVSVLHSVAVLSAKALIAAAIASVLGLNSASQVPPARDGSESSEQAGSQAASQSSMLARR